MKKTIWFDATESRYHTEDARQFLPVRLREEKGRYYHPLNYFKSQGRSSGWVIRFGCSARLGCRSCRWIIIRMIYTIVAILRSLLTSTMICPVLCNNCKSSSCTTWLCDRILCNIALDFTHFAILRFALNGISNGISNGFWKNHLLFHSSLSSTVEHLMQKIIEAGI